MQQNTSWVHKSQAPEDFAKEFPEISLVSSTLLWQKGLRDQKSIDEFFNPDYSSDLHDPFLLKGAREAADRIFKALKNKEEVVIYGDYDSDGVCGATILTEALRTIGFKSPGIYLPDREKEGYGLKVGPVEEFIKNGYSLVITVDCGTTSHDAISLAARNKIDTIVIDHHRVIGKPPKCAAFVNAHQDGDKYPFKDLCGAAAAFKIACALFLRLREICTESNPAHIGCADCVPEGREKWLLDLAAIATITDVMPLLGENRTIVKYGLFVLAQTQRPGLRALMDVSGVKPTFEEESLSTNINPFTVGFVLGPRINAAGRMDHANAAFALLNAKNYEEGLELAKQIDNSNRDRQRLVEDIVKQVEGRISDSEHSDAIRRLGSLVIFEGDKSWPVGVVGIVAGRVVERYQKPAFVYQIKEDGTCAGSIRTIEGFNVVHALESVKDILINFGGHPEAGGFTVSAENVGKMKEGVEEFARKNLKKEDFTKKLEYDMKLSYNDISWQTHDEIQKFQPFGEANREPIFLMKNVKVLSSDVFQKNNGNGNGKKHLRLFLDIDGKQIKAMAFGIGDRADDLKAGDSADILFNFAIDEWNGTRNLMLKVVDFKISDK